jgi:hypothetical protein
MFDVPRDVSHCVLTVASAENPLVEVLELLVFGLPSEPESCCGRAWVEVVDGLVGIHELIQLETEKMH